jgi:regulator of replication initiation timing
MDSHIKSFLLLCKNNNPNTISQIINNIEYNINKQTIANITNVSINNISSTAELQSMIGSAVMYNILDYVHNKNKYLSGLGLGGGPDINTDTGNTIGASVDKAISVISKLQNVVNIVKASGTISDKDSVSTNIVSITDAIIDADKKIKKLAEENNRLNIENNTLKNQLELCKTETNKKPIFDPGVMRDEMSVTKLQSELARAKETEMTLTARLEACKNNYVILKSKLDVCNEKETLMTRQQKRLIQTQDMQRCNSIAYDKINKLKGAVVTLFDNSANN